MFDRAACVACRRVDVAHVGLDTLTSLAELVRDAGSTSLDKSDSSSRAGAALDSEPTIRRSANAAQNDKDATRAVPGDPIHSCDTNTALAEPARRHAASASSARPCGALRWWIGVDQACDRPGARINHPMCGSLEA